MQSDNKTVQESEIKNCYKYQLVYIMQRDKERDGGPTLIDEVEMENKNESEV